MFLQSKIVKVKGGVFGNLVYSPLGLFKTVAPIMNWPVWFTENCGFKVLCSNPQLANGVY